MFAAVLGSVTNIAQPGHGVPDQAATFYGQSVAADAVSVLCFGTNDNIAYGNSAARQEAYRDGMRSYIVGRATNRKSANDSALIYTGTWGGPHPYAGGVSSSNVGAKVDIPCAGNVLYVDLVRLGSGPAAAVKFTQGAVDLGTYSLSQAAASVIQYYGGQTDFGPKCIALRGVTPGAVTMEVVSGTVYFTGYSEPSPFAYVFVLNVPNSLSYATGGTQAGVNALNALLDADIAQLQADGLTRVRLVNVNASLKPDYMADDRHPNNTGHLIVMDDLMSEYLPAVFPSVDEFQPVVYEQRNYPGAPVFVVSGGVRKLVTPA